MSIKSVFTKKRTTVLISIAIAVLLLEIFIFNIAAFRLFAKKGYDEKQLELSRGYVRNMEYDRSQKGFVNSGDDPLNAEITLTNIDAKVGTIYFDIVVLSKDAEGESEFNADISFTDETNAELRQNHANAVITPSDKRSHYAVCEFSGKVGVLNFSFELNENQKILLKGITVNKNVPFAFNFGRAALLFGIAVLLYALFAEPLFKSSFKSANKDDRKIKRGIIALTVAIAVTLAFSMTVRFGHGEFTSKTVKEDFTKKAGNQITMEIVDAFKAKQVSLLEKPSPQLLALKNPYDRSAREGIYYKWDHLLFKGKYYSYYGIAPVITLFLPYHVITGHYFPSSWAIFFYGAGGIIFLSLIYCWVINRYFRKLPFGMALSGLILMLASCGVWYCFRSHLFYEIAQSSGLFFITGGTYFLLNSGLLHRHIKKGRAFYVKTALSTVFLSLAVLSRPTLAIYALFSLPFYFYGLRNVLKKAVSAAVKSKSFNKQAVIYLVCVLLPFAVFGGIQAWYNYARFGSIFDFGIQYSLTINDFTKTELHLKMVLIGFYNFFLAAPEITSEFPFIHTTFDKLGLNGYYFISTRHAIGFLYRATPIFALLFGGKLLSKFKPAKKTKTLLLWGLPCLIAPLIIIFSIWESGYAVRYCVDFTWQLLIAGLAVIFAAYLRYEQRSNYSNFSDNVAIAVFRNALIACCVGCVAVNMAMIYGYGLG